MLTSISSKAFRMWSDAMPLIIGGVPGYDLSTLFTQSRTVWTLLLKAYRWFFPYVDRSVGFGTPEVDADAFGADAKAGTTVDSVGAVGVVGAGDGAVGAVGVGAFVAGWTWSFGGGRFKGWGWSLLIPEVDADAFGADAKAGAAADTVGAVGVVGAGDGAVIFVGGC